MGWGEIKHGLKRLQCAPLHADVQSHLSAPFTIQALATLATGQGKLARALLCSVITILLMCA